MSETNEDPMDNTAPLMWFAVVMVVVVLGLLVGTSSGLIDRGMKENALSLAAGLMVVARYAWAISIPVLLVMILRRLPPKS